MYMNKAPAQDIAQILRTYGSKATPSRIAVLSALMDSHAPLSVEDIAHVAKRTMDTSTVYRIVEAFSIAGIAKKIELGKDKAFYEYAKRPHHHHIVCNSCGQIEDIENSDIETTLKKATTSSKKFAHVTSHSLEFFGTCKTCIKK